MMHLVLFALLGIVSTVHGFPDGAGGCDAGPAVRGLHLDDSNGRVVSAGDLASSNVEFKIDGIVMQPDSPVDFGIGQDYVVEIESLEFPLRGALFRLEAPDGVNTTAVLSPGDLMKVAAVCQAPIVGTTHFNRETKTKMTSIVRFDEPVDGVFFDVTGVFINNADGSVFVFQRFQANFVSASQTMPSPAASPPSEAPAVTDGPTFSTSPLAIESESPVAAPQEGAPTAETTDAPEEAPIAPPMARPFARPVAPPVRSPENSPASTDQPSTPPSADNQHKPGQPGATESYPVPRSSKASKGKGASKSSKGKGKASKSSKRKGSGTSAKSSKGKGSGTSAKLSKGKGSGTSAKSSKGKGSKSSKSSKKQKKKEVSKSGSRGSKSQLKLKKSKSSKGKGAAGKGSHSAKGKGAHSTKGKGSQGKGSNSPKDMGSQGKGSNPPKGAKSSKGKGKGSVRGPVHI